VPGASLLLEPTRSDRACAIVTPEWGLAVAYGLAALARATVIALIPIMAYRQLGSAQNVSELYLIASLGGIAVNLSLPRMLHGLGRWPVFVLAAAAGAGSALALVSGSLPGLMVGLMLQVLMVLIFENVITLFVLDYIARRRLAAFEPRRVLLGGIAYIIGPWLGVWMAERFAPGSALALSALCAIAVPISVYFLVATRQAQVDAPPTGKSGSNIRKFLGQPRLRLAWMLATLRASWWWMFMVYTPIIAVSRGLGSSGGALLIAGASALLLLAPLWRRLAQRTGMRWLLMGSYTVSGISTVSSGMVLDNSVWIGATMLLLAAVAMSAIDAMGNVPFLRAVRAHQRTAMLPIYSTYRDVAQIAPAGLFAILLLFMPLPTVFVVIGILMFVAAAFCGLLPRRL
jgi:hypothetical protein